MEKVDPSGERKKRKRNPLVETVHQAKRLIRIVVGFTLVILGVIMLVTPGPAMVVIPVGLALLATEFVWARRLMKRFKKEAVNMKNSLLNNSKKKE